MLRVTCGARVTGSFRLDENHSDVHAMDESALATNNFEPVQ